MTKVGLGSLSCLAASVLLALLVSTTAAAQAQTEDASPSSSNTIEEIVVSASRREQNLQDVGTSIAAISADELKTMGTPDLTALSTRVPALQYNAFSPAVTVFNIRGVSQNDYGEQQEAPIAVYSDDSYISAVGAVGLQMFDLSDVEVVRGPQGTLFGRNATGGLIHMITAKPTDTLDGYFSATYGSYDMFDTEGAIGGPLSDTVRARVSFATNDNVGYITNRTGPNVGNANNYALRLQLETDINSDAKFLISVHEARDAHERYGYAWGAAYPGLYGRGYPEPPNVNFWGTCPGCDAQGYKNGDDPFSQSYDAVPHFDRTMYGTAGTLTWRLPFATLTSVTDYSHLYLNYQEDSDASPNPIETFNPIQTQYQYSEEIRLAGSSGPWNWSTGLFYLDIHSDANTNSLTPPTDADAIYTTLTRSWAVFGQTDYKFNSQWSATAGLRYSSDRKQQDYLFTYTDTPNVTFNPGNNPNASKNFDGVSAKAELDFKPVEHLLTYVSYNRGIKSGGFFAPTFAPANVNAMTFQNEVLTDYEGGFKLSALNGRLTLDADQFYYNYHNYQLFSYFDFFASITNHDAVDKGTEIELVTKPLDGLTVRLGDSMLTTNVRHVGMPDQVTYVDTYLPQAPANSSTLLVRYEHTVGHGIASLQTDWKHDASMYFTAVNNGDERQGPVTHGNVRAAYDFDDNHWEVAAFVNNVTNEVYSIFRSDFSSVGLYENSLARPRWYGLNIRYSLR
jgi:iron complex outermembrane recepter protein